MNNEKITRIPLIVVLALSLACTCPLAALADNGTLTASKARPCKGEAGEPKSVKMWVVSTCSYKGYDYPKTTYSYNDEGLLTLESTQTRKAGEAICYEGEDYCAAADCSECRLTNISYEYNEKNQMIKRVLSYDKEMTPYIWWNCKYDKEGRLAKMSQRSSNEYTDTPTKRFKYNRAGKCVKTIETDKQNGTAMKTVDRFFYGKKGRLKSVWEDDYRKYARSKRYERTGGGSMIYWYDKRGNLSRVRNGITSLYGYKSCYRNIYKKGRLVMRKSGLKRTDWNVFPVMVYTYRQISVPASQVATVKKQQRRLFNPSPFGELMGAIRVLD